MKKILFGLAIAASFAVAGATTTHEAFAQNASYKIVSGAPGCNFTWGAVTLKNNTSKFLTGYTWVQMQNDSGSGKWAGWVKNSSGGYHKVALVANGTGSLSLPYTNFKPNWVRVYIDGYGWSAWAHSYCNDFSAPYY